MMITNRPAYLSGIFDTYNLQLEGDGNHEAQDVTLPEELEQSQKWIRIARVCAEACYNLYPHAGETILYDKYSITEKSDGRPLDLWIITKADEPVCVYKAVRESSGEFQEKFPVKADCVAEDG